MGRKPEGTIKIWRETLNAIAKEHGTSVAKVSEMMGRDATWIYKKMPKGFGLFNEIEAIAMASVIGCQKDDLTKIPISESMRGMTVVEMKPMSAEAMDDILSEVQALTAEVAMGFKAAEKDRTTMTKQDELYDLVRSSAKMLHTDLMTILAYLKGEEKTE